MARAWFPLVVMLLFSFSLLGADAPAPFRYSYYLFEVPAGQADCSHCYIPLLVTREPLEKAKQPDVAVIITHERDSIWKLGDRPVKLAKGAVQADERQIRFEEKLYRYQLVSNEETIRLLQRPDGKLPIGRLELPINGKNEPFRKTLLRDLGVADKKAADKR